MDSVSVVSLVTSVDVYSLVFLLLVNTSGLQEQGSAHLQMSLYCRLDYYNTGVDLANTLITCCNVRLSSFLIGQINKIKYTQL